MDNSHFNLNVKISTFIWWLVNFGKIGFTDCPLLSFVRIVIVFCCCGLTTLTIQLPQCICFSVYVHLGTPAMPQHPGKRYDLATRSGRRPCVGNWVIVHTIQASPIVEYNIQAHTYNLRNTHSLGQTQSRAHQLIFVLIHVWAHYNIIIIITELPNATIYILLGKWWLNV